jgi:NAD dependent epimerase/dehydratase
MDWTHERVLVTGAGGFIGSHLCELLARKGARVRAAVHYNSRDDRGHLDALDPAAAEALEVRALDVVDPFAMLDAVSGCSVVFHLAALIGIPYSYSAPSSYLETNVRGTINVLEACRRGGVRRLVHTSTSEVYGTARFTPMDESHPLAGQSPYAASKIAADHFVESYHRSFGVPVATLRPFNTYGPRQSARAIVPTIAAQAVLGNGAIRLGRIDPVRDFTYVTDTARAFVAVAECDAAVGQVVHSGSGAGVAIGELARRIQALAGTSLPVVHDGERDRPAASEVFELVASTERLRTLAGWRPEVDLDAGLQRVIAYVREHAERFRPGVYTR